MKRVDITQQTPEWHEWRKDKIGASDVSSIMGVSPFKSVYGLWLEKTGAVKSTVKMSNSMRRGLDLEVTALQHLANELSVDMQEQICFDNACFQHSKYPHMIASIDGWDSRKEIAVEVKCPGKVDHSLALQGEVPAKYFPQVQYQLYVLGIPKMIYYSFDGQEGVSVSVYEDREYQAKLVDAVNRFYIFNMIGKKPPEKDLFLDTLEYVEDEELEMLTSNLQEAKIKCKEFTDLVDTLSGNVSARLFNLGISEGVVLRDGTQIVKITRKGSIDYSAMNLEEAYDLEKFRKADSIYYKVSQKKV